MLLCGLILSTRKKGIKMNRETWLNTLKDQFLIDHFKNAGYEIPKNIRISCGFVSGRGSKNKAIGVCYSDVISEDQTHEIFIDPTQADSSRVADILIHEIIHATIGLDKKHGKVFKQCATKVGLEGKMTATTASEGLKSKIAEWVSVIGNYPHAELNASHSSNGKKQTTRMVKCECDYCGYTVRLSRKWLSVAIPKCPQCDIEMNYGNNEEGEEGE